MFYGVNNVDFISLVKNIEISIPHIRVLTFVSIREILTSRITKYTARNNLYEK